MLNKMQVGGWMALFMAAIVESGAATLVIPAESDTTLFQKFPDNNLGSSPLAVGRVASGQQTRIHPNIPWNQPGTGPADSAPEQSSTAIITGIGPVVFPSTPSLLADVEAWRQNPFGNFGWLLTSSDASPGGNARRLNSREDLSDKPVLMIDYSLTSSPGGAMTVSCLEGPNFLSHPFPRPPIHEGQAMQVVANAVRVTGAPGWADGELVPKDGFPQFVLRITHDFTATPGNAGDWWPVLSNDRDSVQLSIPNGAQPPVDSLGTGDSVEIVPLTSIADWFGLPEVSVMEGDSDGVSSSTDEDVVYFLTGTGFGMDLIRHNGSLGSGTAGYYVSGAGPFDGTSIRLLPKDQVPE